MQSSFLPEKADQSHGVVIQIENPKMSRAPDISRVVQSSRYFEPAYSRAYLMPRLPRACSVPCFLAPIASGLLLRPFGFPTHASVSSIVNPCIVSQDGGRKGVAAHELFVS